MGGDGRGAASWHRPAEGVKWRGEQRGGTSSGSGGVSCMWGALGGKGGEPVPKVQHHMQRWQQEGGLEGECTCLWSPGSGLPRAGECRGCPKSESPTVAEDPERGRTEGRGPVRHFRWEGTRTVSNEEHECSEGPENRHARKSRCLPS